MHISRQKSITSRSIKKTGALIVIISKQCYKKHERQARKGWRERDKRKWLAEERRQERLGGTGLAGKGRWEQERLEEVYLYPLVIS